MANPTDSNVQLPGGTQTGPQVRSMQLYILDSGVLTPVQMQVIQIADDQGNILGNAAAPDIQNAVLAELRAIRRLLAQQAGIFDAVPDAHVELATQQQ